LKGIVFELLLLDGLDGLSLIDGTLDWRMTIDGGEFDGRRRRRW